MLRTVRVFARDLVSQRPVCAEEDVHFSEGLAAAVIDAFSGKGDRVLDPFAGFGTTLVVSERMGRTAVGIELLPDRVAMIAARLGGAARVLQGDARRLDDLGLGSFELCLTSPPYMTAFAHPQNPLTGYRTLDGSYPVYLAELGDVFSAVGRHLTPGGHCLINVANIRTADGVTPLAWDLAGVVSQHLRFEGEIYVDWDAPPPSVTGDYCLVFSPG